LTTLTILGHEGDSTLTWNPQDPQEVAAARLTVLDLSKQGYAFFLVDGTPADAVTAGQGTLIVRKLTPEEVVEPPAEKPPPDAASPPRRRGRKGVPNNTVVATRPIAGG